MLGVINVRSGFAAAVLAALPAAGYFAGPAHVGDTVTYRITTTDGADPQAAPATTTIVINWKSEAHMFARIDGVSTVATIVTRGADGALALASPNPSDPSSALLSTRLAQLNFPGRLAVVLGGSDHAQTTLQVTPPAQPQRTPLPMHVPVFVDLVDSGSSGATLIADGNSAQGQQFNRGSAGGGRRGGSGGWQRGGPGNGHRPGAASGAPQTAEIAVEATFDRHGMLVHETYRETFTTASSNAKPTVERTVTIDVVR